MDSGGKKGKLYVIEGLDGSGKATQAKRMAERLSAAGSRVTQLSFPCYESDSSALIRMYLSGGFGENPNSVNAYAASTFYAADRYANYKTAWEKRYLAGGVFVADRYTTSNAVYQMSKLKEDEWDGFLDWLDDFEYHKLGIPSPDCVIYLDLPPDTGARLMLRRYDGDGSRMDIHERDIELQRRGREAALYCAKKQNWRVIRCGEAGEPRPVADISEEIYQVIEKVGR